MGKVKAWAMQLEENFWDKANTIIGGCEHFGEFVEGMKPYRDWLGTHDKNEYAERLVDAWHDYWSKYI